MRAGASTIRRVGFYLLVGLFLALGVMLMVQGRAWLVVTGWFPATDLGAHRVHELVIGWFFLAMIAGAVTQLWGNSQRPSALHQAMALPLMVFIAETLSGQPELPPLIFVVLAAGAGALHPERESVWRLGLWDRWKFRWALLLAIPFVPQIGNHISLQSVNLEGDPHAAAGHWSAMAAIGIGIVVMALLGSQHRFSARFNAVSASVVLSVYALVSLLYPAQASALSSSWATAALAWVVVWSILIARSSFSGEKERVGDVEGAQ